jgi:7,8-dihydropterin-6-yl-methyl-4-(beta-D-ribofuranosyl)aminobenzene 5'-phosphate synthase
MCLTLGLILALAARAWPIPPAEAAANGAETRITTVYDNTTWNDKLMPAWGFGCLVETAEETVLFDVGGDGTVLMHNVEQLGIDPAVVDKVVLSHAHWDHTAGLEAFMKVRGPVDVYLPASLPPLHRRDIEAWGARVVPVSKAMEIAQGVYTTGLLGRVVMEQSLVVRTPRGSIVITGCAHPGVGRIAEAVREQVPEPILLVIGGFHLLRSEDEAVQRAIEQLQELGVEYAAPCHCTGAEAMDAFRRAFGERFVEVGAGRVITIEELQSKGN